MPAPRVSHPLRLRSERLQLTIMTPTQRIKEYVEAYEGRRGRGSNSDANANGSPDAGHFDIEVQASIATRLAQIYSLAKLYATSIESNLML